VGRGDRTQRGATPQRDIALRLALVHEFRTRTVVFISTEAGAKGLNAVLRYGRDYDLPWNRTHRAANCAATVRSAAGRDGHYFLAQRQHHAGADVRDPEPKLELFGTCSMPPTTSCTDLPATCAATCWSAFSVRGTKWSCAGSTTVPALSTRSRRTASAA